MHPRIEVTARLDAATAAARRATAHEKRVWLPVDSVASSGEELRGAFFRRRVALP